MSSLKIGYKVDLYFKSGVPETAIEPISDNRYMKNRKVFKWVSRILRKTKFYFIDKSLGI